ncbi:MAG: hypothetical protein GY762_09740 [Proteobacteria bacterium]|nr:hypothetical protein [Pseudomonadota bacterium]
MVNSAEINKWYKKLSAQLVVLSEARQRTILFADGISNLEPAVASPALSYVLTTGFCLRSRPSTITTEAALLAIVEKRWPEEHRRDTYLASTADGERLTALFLRQSMGESPDNEEEEASIPVPVYNPSRPLTLGERRSLASRPDRSLIEKAICDPHPKVIAKLLDNPKLTENDVVFISTRRPASPEVLAVVAFHPRWRPNQRIGRALIYNPSTPSMAALTLLPGLDKQTVVKIAKDIHLNGPVREASAKLLQIKATKKGNFAP